MLNVDLSLSKKRIALQLLFNGFCEILKLLFYRVFLANVSKRINLISVNFGNDSVFRAVVVVFNN